MIGILWPAGGRSSAGSVGGKRYFAAFLALGFALIGASSASADTRSLKLFNLHTREKAEIVFKRDGRFDSDGLRKLNMFLRDWRKNEPTRMDPRLFDVIWEAYRQSGSSEYINVVCGYRSPETNSMLRSRSRGVAKQSQHMLGRAMDFFIPGVPLKKLREIGLKMQGGGVGYYPTSGSPFVHFDVGNVRHWPKMSRQELIALFPNGKTLHIPSDGKPLPGFEEAVASYEARKKSGEVAIAALGSRSSSSRSGGLLARLFGGGGGADDEEDSAQGAGSAGADDEGAQPQPTTVVAKAEVRSDDAKPGNAKPGNKIRILSPDQANRADVPGVTAEPQPQTIVAALPPRDVPLPQVAPRPQVDVGPNPAGLYGANGQPGAEPETLVALNIPVPTPRPEIVTAPPPELAGDKPAITEAAYVVADAKAPLPTGRPGDVDDDEIAPLIAAMPEPRPEDDLDDGEDAYTVAALPETVPVAAMSAATAPVAPPPIPVAAPFRASPEEIIPEVKTPQAEVLSYAASPRTALVNRAPGTDPTAAVTSAVKTTAKAARPTRNDLKKGARLPMTVAAQPTDARWALDRSYVMQKTQDKTAPSVAHSLVRHAPTEVYTAGFQQGTEIADANRFTGKAVTFLSVAKFSTN
ncbi:DUF882 domain-containing protein [Mesorhizobium sp. BAC0120]|uniref:DUF882 domain-containing protein n=1 Tax=Mesorhizobium sp. BAC0120 TaxID=3090670 RepID=UPI00298C3C3D|nr:DUF882 domain-containing protein [Mesorhizobium sp. BAC0120]MDW6025067.1 DUF882 domain-containing protein [Mesorhizobium sp. BAC0120]